MMARRGLKLSGMSVTELVDLRKEVERTLNDRIGREQSELRARIDALAALQMRPGKASLANGVTRKGRRGRKVHALKGRKVAPKYRGPNGETWSGRGLAPRWLADLEKKGRKRDSFLIQSG
jgi:DNA-binding protein H-NS